jgi:hypothetical protein
MTSLQASVGAEAIPPTTGMALIPADATRQGAAAAPQPLSMAESRSRHEKRGKIPEPCRRLIIGVPSTCTLHFIHKGISSPIATHHRKDLPMLRLFSLFVVLLFGSSALAETMTEQQKIDALLGAFDTPGITFIRNGEEHDGAWAKQHLTDKLKAAKPEVTTADDFITTIATTSSKTGKPYLIKTSDGKTIKSGVWLKKKLAEINSKDTGGKN